MYLQLGKIKAIHILWCLLFFLLLFESPLMEWLPIFAYTDEAVSLMGLGMIFYRGIRTGRMGISRSTMTMTMLLLVFAAAGLLGNMIYQYQPTRIVLTDILTNFKFYLMIITGVSVFSNRNRDEISVCLTKYARLGTLVLFFLLVADLLFQMFPSGGTRYGLRVVTLFYSQPTYMAGAVVFLIVVLTLFYHKKNIPYLVMCGLLLLSTLRGKAIAAAACYMFLFILVVLLRKKLRLWHLIVMGFIGIILVWEQIAYYFIDLQDESARAALTRTSFEILRDYFPIGTGFGTFASHSAVESYSPVYYLYNLNEVWGLGESYTAFSSDTFWPIIFGQTGLIGTIGYVGALGLLFIRILKIRKKNLNAYAAGVFIIAYLLISSMAEPAFNNLIATPLAMMIGYILTIEQESSVVLSSDQDEGNVG